MNSYVLYNDDEQKYLVKIKKALNDDFANYFKVNNEYKMNIENGYGYDDRRINLFTEKGVLYQIYFYRNGYNNKGEHFDNIFRIITTLEN